MKNSNQQLRFFSNVTAGVSHELNNVLSVIKENTGLMEDLFLMAAKQGIALPYEDKVKKSLSAIRDTIKRGAQITSDLNTFAHSPDHEKKAVRIPDSLEMISRLNNRKASRAGIKTEICKKPEQTGESDFMTLPVLFYRLFHLVTGVLVDSAENEGKLLVNWSVNGDEMQVDYTFDNPAPSIKEKISGHFSYADILDAGSDLSADISVSDKGIHIRFKQI